MSESIDRRFNRLAEGYARYRPTCPAELVDRIAGECSSHRLAWEPGCGSGQATPHLAARFDDVLATDPAASAVASATPIKSVRYEVGRAESCSLERGVVDCVAVAQAAHWFDMDAFAVEVRRVAAPSCVVALWCYDRPRTSPAVDAVVDHLYFDVLAGCWDSGRAHIDTRYADLVFPFNERSINVPNYEMSWTADQMIGYLSTWSAVDTFAERGGGDAVGCVASDLRKAWGDVERRVQWPVGMRFGTVT